MLIPEGTTDEEDHSPPLKGWGDMPLQLKQQNDQTSEL